MRIIMYLLLLIVVGLGISFAVLNSEKVLINYFVGKTTLSLSLLLVFVFSLGCLLGLLVGCWFLFKLRLKNYHLCQKLKIVEKEVQNLRAIPLQDKH